MRPLSKKPKKQRKYNFATPLKETHKLMSANLSPELRASQGFRSLPVVAGDTVTVMRGKYRGRSGKISRVEPQKQRAYIEKISRGKSDKTEIPVPIHPSNLMITKYVKKDKRRMILINRRIKEEDEKIDIDSVLAENLAAEEDAIEIEDDFDEDLDEDVEVIDAELDEEFEEEEEDE